MEGHDDNNATITRNVEAGDHELCINLRVKEAGAVTPRCSFGCGYSLTLTAGTQPLLDVDGFELPLPAAYDPGEFCQFRIVRRKSSIEIFLDADRLGSYPAAEGEFVRIMAQNSIVELDMVRYTPL